MRYVYELVKAWYNLGKIDDDDWKSFCTLALEAAFEEPEDECDCDGECHHCGDPCCYNHPEYGVEDMPPEMEEEPLRSILDMFRMALSFDE